MFYTLDGPRVCCGGNTDPETDYEEALRRYLKNKQKLIYGYQKPFQQAFEYLAIRPFLRAAENITSDKNDLSKSLSDFKNMPKRGATKTKSKSATKRAVRTAISKMSKSFAKKKSSSVRLSARKSTRISIPRATATRSYAAPVAISSSSPPVGMSYYKLKGGLGIRGCDLLATLGSPNNIKVGELIGSYNVNPSTIGGTRLRTMSTLFEYYKFRKVIFHYRPAVPTNTPGLLFGMYDPDPADPVEPGSISLETAYQHPGAHTTAMWTESDWVAPPWKTPFSKFYTEQYNSDIRLANQFIFYLLAGTAITAGNLVGHLFVTYDVAFTGPTAQITSGLMFYAQGVYGTTSQITGDSATPNWFWKTGAENGMAISDSDNWYVNSALIGGADLGSTATTGGFQLTYPVGTWFTVISMPVYNTLGTAVPSVAVTTASGSSATVNFSLGSDNAYANNATDVNWTISFICTVPPTTSTNQAVNIVFTQGGGGSGNYLNVQSADDSIPFSVAVFQFLPSVITSTVDVKSKRASEELKRYVKEQIAFAIASKPTSTLTIEELKDLPESDGKTECKHSFALIAKGIQKCQICGYKPPHHTHRRAPISTKWSRDVSPDDIIILSADELKGEKKEEKKESPKK